jgi:ribosomal protein L29
LLKIQEIDREIRKKYPDDMVENLAESPGMSSDGPGSALIKIPKRELFSLREGKKKGEGGELHRWRKERRG